MKKCSTQNSSYVLWTPTTVFASYDWYVIYLYKFVKDLKFSSIFICYKRYSVFSKFYQKLLKILNNIENILYVKKIDLKLLTITV